MGKTVIVKTYKIPVTRDKKGKVKLDVTLELNDDMVVNKYEHEFTGAISIELPDFTKQVGNYNKRQIIMANADKDMMFYRKRIVCKE